MRACNPASSIIFCQILLKVQIPRQQLAIPLTAPASSKLSSALITPWLSAPPGASSLEGGTPRAKSPRMPQTVPTPPPKLRKGRSQAAGRRLPSVSAGCTSGPSRVEEKVPTTGHGARHHLPLPIPLTLGTRGVQRDREQGSPGPWTLRRGRSAGTQTHSSGEWLSPGRRGAPLGDQWPKQEYRARVAAGPGAARPDRPRMARPENPVGREVALPRSARGPRLCRPRGRSIPFPKREKLVSGKLKPGAGPRSLPGRRGCGSRAGAPPRARHVHSPGSWCRRPRRDRCRYSRSRRREPGTEGRARGAECRRPRSGRAARRTAPGRAGARRAPGWPGSRRGAPRRAAGAAGAAGPARAAAGHGAPGRGGAAWLTEWARSGAEPEPELGPELGRGGGGGEGCSVGPGASCSCGNRGSRATTGGACGAGKRRRGARRRGRKGAWGPFLS